MTIRIKEVAKSKGYTMKDLASKIGVSQMALSFWQTGKRDASYSTLNNIAAAIGVSVHELIEDDKSENQYNSSGEWKGVFPKK